MRYRARVRISRAISSSRLGFIKREIGSVALGSGFACVRFAGVFPRVSRAIRVRSARVSRSFCVCFVLFTCILKACHLRVAFVSCVFRSRFTRVSRFFGARFAFASRALKHPRPVLLFVSKEWSADGRRR